MDLARAAADLLPGIAVSTREVDLGTAGRDAWPRQLIEQASGPRAPEGPALVAWPEHPEQVEQIVGLARREGWKLVPYGAGSGVCGAISPERGSLVIDTKRLVSLRIDRDAGAVEVGAGMLGIDLENELERHGVTVGHFPSSILCSTVGGWLAARGAGQCSSRYGKIEDMVRSADAVLGTADSVTFSRRLGGPNPLDLLIGSEGTLGIITSARLRLHQAPAQRVLAAFSLPTFDVGALAMRQLMQAGLRPAVMRLYDPIDSYLLSRGKVKDPSGREPSGVPSGFWLRTALGSPRLLQSAIEALERTVMGAATLILIFEGAADRARDESAEAERLLFGLGGKSLGEAPARAWLAHRYAVSYRQSKVFQQGAFNDTLEVAAPWSRLADVYAAVRERAGRHALVLAHLSHAYPDGCSIYFTLVATRAGDALARYDSIVDAVLSAALAEGATLSHHHGVGTSKAHFLDAELGGGVPVLERVRSAWDPDGLLSPRTLHPLRNAPLPYVRQLTYGIDAVSGIATYGADVALKEIEEQAQTRGLTLGLTGPIPALTLGAFIDSGLTGAPDPFADPVRGQVCGLAAKTAHGGFRLAAAPRRATGPSLFALCIGVGGAIANVESASLVLVRQGARGLSADVAPSVPLAPSEESAFQLLTRAFSD